MHHTGAPRFTSFFSSRDLVLNEIVPWIVPNARVWPSALQLELMIFSLYLIFGISFLPGVYKLKSETPPLKSSWVIGLNAMVIIASL